MTTSKHTTHPQRRATDRALPRPPGVPFVFPPAPLDARLVAMCAEFSTNERARRRVIGLLPRQPASAAKTEQAAALRAVLARLTAERHDLVHGIATTKARTIDGIKKKAGVMRLLVEDLPAPGDVRIGMADSLATDAVLVLA